MSESVAENVDCMIRLHEAPDNYWDLAIVDPPYGIGDFNMKTGSGGKTNKREYNDDISWNSAIPDNGYFTQLKRTSKRRIIWGANYFNCFESGALVWFKNIGHPNLSQCEIASMSFQKKVDFVQINWTSGFYRQIAENSKIIHPCQKPTSLYKWLLKNYAKPGDKILDTHLGSGSSRIAAYDLCFDFTGYELDTDYFNAQEERFQRHIAQANLFADMPTKQPIQEELPL